MPYLVLCCLLWPPEEMEEHWLCILGVSILVFFPLLMTTAFKCFAQWWKRGRMAKSQTASSLTHTYTQARHIQGNSPYCICVRTFLLRPQRNDGDELSIWVKIVWQKPPLLSLSSNNLICFCLPLVSTATVDLVTHCQIHSRGWLHHLHRDTPAWMTYTTLDRT